MLNRRKLRALAEAAALEQSLSETIPGRTALAARSNARLYRLATPEVIAELCTDGAGASSDPDLSAFRRAIAEHCDRDVTEAIVQRAREISAARDRPR